MSFGAGNGDRFHAQPPLPQEPDLHDVVLEPPRQPDPHPPDRLPVHRLDRGAEDRDVDRVRLRQLRDQRLCGGLAMEGDIEHCGFR